MSSVTLCPQQARLPAPRSTPRRGGRGMLRGWLALPTVWLVALALAPLPAGAALETLPAISAPLGETTVSGLSSGGYMAVQFHVSHSSIVRGAGVIAGGPFGCAEGNVERALGPCMEGTPDALALAERLAAEARAGHIDAPDNLAGHPVWLFSGSNDGVVRRPVVRALEAFYRRFAPASRIFLQDSHAAGHVFPTRAVAAPCGETGGTFLANCGYDAAGELLQQLYGRLSPPTPGVAPAGRLVEFDQRPFIAGSQRASGLSDRGFLFLPQRCESGEACRIHVAFHGCRQNAATIDRAFVEQAGYNAWAAANGIAVLYPQTMSTWGMPFNPKGCWDWWGYTGATYATKAGAQVSAVRAMLGQLASPRSGVSAAQPAAGVLTPQLAGEAADDALAVRWPAAFKASEVWLVNAGQRTLIGRPAANDSSWVARDLLPGRSYTLEVHLRPRTGGAAVTSTASLALTTRQPAPDCDTYFSDNVRHATRGRATPWWGRAVATGTGDDLGWWTVWSESQVTRVQAGFRRGGCR